MIRQIIRLLRQKEAYVYINPLDISRVRKIDVYSPNVILEGESIKI